MRYHALSPTLSSVDEGYSKGRWEAWYLQSTRAADFPVGQDGEGQGGLGDGREEG
jgi:hypothetical protein